MGLMTRDVCLNDDAFGPVLNGCPDNFDFTLLFQQAFLSIAPSSVFIVVAAIRVAYLRRQPRIVGSNRFQILKIVIRSFWLMMILS